MDSVPAGAWDEVAKRAEDATFFHTRHWIGVARASDPRLRDISFAGSLEDGARFVYPLVSYPSGAGISSFAGCYGGPVAERPIRPAEAHGLHLEALARCRGSLGVTLGPWSARTGRTAEFEASDDSTHVIDLREDFDDLPAGSSRKHRQAYRRSLRDGVTVARAGEDRLSTYLDLYTVQLERWGERASSIYPPATFERLARLAAEHPDAVQLWEARLDGRTVSAVWALYWNRHAVLWHQASAELGHGMISPSIALIGEVMQDARRRGFERFDLNPSGGHEQVAAYKRRFGAAELPVVRLLGRRRPTIRARARATAGRTIRMVRPGR